MNKSFSTDIISTLTDTNSAQARYARLLTLDQLRELPPGSKIGYIAWVYTIVAVTTKSAATLRPEEVAVVLRSVGDNGVPKAPPTRTVDVRYRDIDSLYLIVPTPLTEFKL